MPSSSHSASNHSAHTVTFPSLCCTSNRTSAGSPRRHFLVAVISTWLPVAATTLIGPFRFFTRSHLPSATAPDQRKALSSVSRWAWAGAATSVRASVAVRNRFIERLLGGCGCCRDRDRCHH